MNFAESLLHQGRDTDVAIISGTRSWSYSDLRSEVKRLSCLPTGKGERIGILSENSAFFIASYLAIIRSGAIAVPLPSESSPEQVHKLILGFRLCGLFVSVKAALRHGTWLKKGEHRLLLESDPVAMARVESPATPACEESDLASLMFTSGSTGEPKGVMLTHRNLTCNTGDIVSYMGLNRNDRVMVVLPFHYCFGLSQLHTVLKVGASLVLNNDFRLYPESMLGEMRAHGCTGLAGVPSTYQILLRRTGFTRMAFPSLRWLQQAGGKLPDSSIREVVAAFPAVRFFTMYGQTEGAARLSFLPPEFLLEKIGSIGKGLPSTKLEVLTSDGRPVVPGSNEIGQIVAEGQNIARGYWDDLEETSKYFKSGKLYTGDIARVDSEGFIFIVDRERDMIKCGGHRISPKEIENVISKLSEVAEAAVIGRCDAFLGEALVAFVELCTGTSLSDDAIMKHCRQLLPSYKVPAEIVFLPQMPLNSSGKISKERLRQLLPGASGLKPSPSEKLEASFVHIKH